MLNHVGIIMDGNRRWAKKRFLPSVAGHKAGAENVSRIVEFAVKKDIKFITFWALSTENLIKREEKEVKAIIALINNADKYLGDMLDNGVKLETIGDISKLPAKSQEILQKLKDQTQHNKKITLTLALVYGGQDEIVRATKKIISSGIDPNSLNQQEFRKYIDSYFLPEVDLIIRTGGDIRHSGFLLYDSAYSEYFFTETKWPDFSPEEFQEAINTFNNSKRNFGK